MFIVDPSFNPTPWKYSRTPPPTPWVLPHTEVPKRQKRIEAIHEVDQGYWSIMVDHVERARVFDAHYAVKVALMFERED